jgi:1,2-diacylglycerol 3-alpha-glucosyltransferase
MKNIILLSNAYWPSIGGVENSLRHLALEALSVGDKVKIVVSDLGVLEVGAERFREVIDGVEVLRYPLKPFHLIILSPFNFLYSCFQQYRLLSGLYKAAPNSIVIARFHVGVLMAKFAGFNDIRYLVPSIINNQVDEERPGGSVFFKALKKSSFRMLHNKLQKMALKYSDGYVFSETMKAQCKQLEVKDYLLTKPGVDQIRFKVVSKKVASQLRVKLNLPLDKKIVLFVGRFVRAKGVELLIESIPQVDDENYFVLVGDGLEKINYQNKINDLGLEHRVLIVPPLKVVEDYYKCSDVFVMCSSYEPLGQTILEAFSSGLPLVAFKKSSSVDTATSELGMDEYVEYAAEHDSKSLAKAINKKLSTLDAHNKEAVSAISLKKFSWKCLYDELTFKI